MKAVSVSFWGMHDNHTFHRIKGSSVDEIISNWLDYNKAIDKATGASWLCPATVIGESKKEMRRVGKGICPNYKTGRPRDEADVIAFAEVLLKDPDIPRLLAENACKPD